MDTAAFRHDFFLILPEVELALFGLAILLFDFMLGVKDKAGNAVFAMLGVIFSGISLYRLRALGPDAVGGFNSSIVVDPFFLFFGMIFLIATALVILLSVRYLQIEDEHHGEYYALLLFATVGMMFMASGYDLIVQFLGLETMAISFYILTGFLRHQRRSNEAAVKYLLLGAFSSGLLAYGFSLLYGISAMAQINGPLGLPLQVPRTNLDVVRTALELRGPTDLLVMLAIVTVAAGLFFKVAAVPFHQWAPDVYEGAPTTDHGLRQRGFEDGEFRAAAAALPLRLLAGARELDRNHRGGGRRVAHARQFRGDHADQRQAPAGVLLDLARRLYSARPGGGAERAGRKRDRAEGHRLLSFRLRLHDHRRFRHHHRAAAARTDRRRTRRPERPDRAQSRVGRAAADLHAVAGGNSAAGRLCGQVLHLALADRDATLLPGAVWRALHRSGAVLLLPDRGARLAARAGKRGAHAGDARASRWRWR